MPTDERIIQGIFAAVDELNEFLPQPQRIEKSMQTVLFGESAHLDSLAFVSLIVAIEQKIQDKCAVAITLSDSDMFSQEDGPFKTVQKLADHISLLLDGKEQ